MSQSDDNQILYPVRIDIPPEIRLYVIQLLQQTLACTVDLRSQIKQACWNVKGHDLVLLHALFATMATELDAYTDLVAERLVVLGGVARGTARTAATHSTLPEYPGPSWMATPMCGRWRSASRPTPRPCGQTLRTRRRSRMRVVRRSTPISRVGSINGSGS